MSKSGSSTRRYPYVILAALVVLVVVGWSFGWFALKDRFVAELDRQLDHLAEGGFWPACSDREINGFPFRYEVTCSNLAVTANDGWSVRTAGLKSVALIYNPWHVITEFEAPGILRVPAVNLSAQMNWETAQSSFKYDASGLTATDIELVDPAFRGSDGLVDARLNLAADNAQMHVRRGVEDAENLDFAASLRSLQSPLLDANLQKANISLVGSLLKGGDMLRGASLQDVAELMGGKLQVENASLRIEKDGLDINLSGPFSIDGTGLISGKFVLSASDPEELVDRAGAYSSEVRANKPLLLGMAQGFMTKADEDGKAPLELPLVVNKGKVSLGIFPIGNLPPVRF